MSRGYLKMCGSKQKIRFLCGSLYTHQCLLKLSYKQRFFSSAILFLLQLLVLKYVINKDVFMRYGSYSVCLRTMDGCRMFSYPFFFFYNNCIQVLVPHEQLQQNRKHVAFVNVEMRRNCKAPMSYFSVVFNFLGRAWWWGGGYITWSLTVIGCLKAGCGFNKSEKERCQKYSC